MDLSPRHLLQKALQATRSFGKAIGRDAEQLAADVKFEADWLVLTVGDTPLPNAAQDLLVHHHQRHEKVPHDGPLLPCPAVKPQGRPVQAEAGRAAELLAGRPAALSTEKPAAAVSFQLPGATEGQLTLQAAAPGTDWGTAGRESAVVSIYVDGHHNQDVVLYGGATQTAYPLSLGALPAGAHTVTFAYNQKASSPGAAGITLTAARLEPSGLGPQGLAEKYQPYFYGRGLDNNHSDVPLMMWCEVSHHGQDTVLSYSVVHSNEDGGTAADPAAEQASWGRETDPDPIARVTVGPDGTIKDVRYDGWLDEFGKFRGRCEGSHPILRVARANNTYDDRGESPLLFRPRVQLKDFTGTSREALMEQNPWMYRISNEELRREGKQLTPDEAAATLANEGQPGFRRPKKVMDLRRYLYVDFAVENPRHTQLAVAVKLKGRDKWYRSDLGDRAVDVLWSGQGLRTAVPLPAGVKPADVETVRVFNEGGSDTTFEGVHKAFMLDDAYEPQYLNLPGHQAPVSLDTHDAADVPNRT